MTVCTVCVSGECLLLCLQLKALEDRVSELDRANKELTDHKYRSEAAIRELKTKLRSSEEVRNYAVHAF